MKKHFSIICLSFIVCYNVSAQTIVDTLPHNRNVVLEQFNGCGFCPDAHRISDSICNLYPNRFFDIRVYTGYYAQLSLPHFITTWGNALTNNSPYSLGGYPEGTINRHKFSASNLSYSYGNGFYLDRKDWATRTDSILAMPSPVNIAAMVDFNDTTRVMTVYVELYYTSSSAQSTNYLNVALLQNNIIDQNISFQQWYPEMEVNDTLYRYMHVLRDLLTGQWGEAINSTTAGSFVSKTYTYAIPDSIGTVAIPSLCDLEVIAFVTESHKEVLTGCRAISNILDTVTENIIVSVNDTNMGSVKVEHCALTGETSLWAIPTYGCSFTAWSDGATDNPRTISDEDTSLTAIFSIRQFYIDLTSSDSTKGTVVGGGWHNYMDTIVISAIPATSHHHFIRWNDNDTSSVRTIVVTKNRSLTAYFDIDKHTVTVAPNNILYGTTEGGGEREYGQPITLTATAYSGYQFVRWSNGATYNPYTFAVTGDTSLVALFYPVDSVFNIVATANPTMGSVQGGGIYGYGDTVVLTATANPGYHFTNWHDGNTENPRSVIATSDITYIAYFATSNEGIDDSPEHNVRVFARNGKICAEGMADDTIIVFDISGRQVVNNNLPSGVYLVKISNRYSTKILILN
jgi:hypothetical protein